MRKNVFLLFAVFTFVFSMSLKAQVIHTVADGTVTNYYIPFYGYYMDYYQHEQVIYPESMLTELEDQTLTSVTFYLSSAPTSSWTSVFNVSLGITESDTFAANDYLSAELTTVYSGTLTISADNKVTIAFSTPFNYSGGNLLLDIATVTLGNYSSAYFYGISSYKSGIYGYNASSVSSISNMHTQNFIPKTSFTFIDTCTTLNLSVSEVTGSSAFVSWTPNPSGAAHQYELAYKLADASTWIPCTIDNTNCYCLLTDLTPEGTYDVRLRTWCGGGYTEDLTTSFATGCTGGGNSLDVTIGSGTGSNSGNRLPINMYYNYSYTQQIFTAEEIGSTTTIDQIDVQYFYGTSYNRNIDIYMGHTTKDYFSSSYDWIPSENMTLVYSGPVTFTNSGTDYWFTIPLTNEFIYNGHDNLVVAFDDNTGTYNNSNNKFYTHESDANRSLEAHTDSYDISPANLDMGGTQSTLRMNMRLPASCLAGGCDRGNVVAVDITATTALLLYTSGTDSDHDEIQLAVKGGSFTTLTPTASPYLLTGLKQNTEYTARIRSHCASGWSEWKVVEFTTKTKNISRLYVKSDGTGDGVSWDEACSDLQWALSTAALIKDATGNAPDIWVAGGIYTGDTTATNAFTMVDGVNVYGGFVGNESEDYDLSQRDLNANPTILDGLGARRVLYQAANFNSLTVWDGFIVRNGRTTENGGGAYLRNWSEMRHCHFEGNSARNGGGAYAYATTTSKAIRFENCEFHGNTSSEYGGGLYSSYSTAKHCIFTHNYASQYGGGIYIYGASNLEATLSNCLVANNSGSHGGGIYSNTIGASVTNTTIVNNEATTAGAGLYANYFGRLTNSILWGNRRSGGVNSIEQNTSTITCTYSGIEGGYPGEGNVSLLPESILNGSLSPLFAHPSAAAGHTDSTDNVDWHLLEGSVCINKGNDSLATLASNTDLDGGERIRHGQVDLGCYESDHDASTLPQIGNIIYVTPTGAGNRDGSSWSDAMGDIQMAEALAVMNGADVWMSEGVYFGDTTSTNAFTMMEGIDVYGGFAGNEPANYNLDLRDFDEHPTILDGQNARRVIHQPIIFKSLTVWDGFTIRNGYYNSSSNGGGGAYIQAGTTLRNCTVTHNHSQYYGGGIYAHGSSSSMYDSTRIINCTITHNTSYQRGGGLYVDGYGVIRHCTISHNTASNGNGGGAYFYGSDISYCTITHNQAVSGSGGGLHQLSSSISNCLIANNTSAGNGGGLLCVRGQVTNCTVVNNECSGTSGIGSGLSLSDNDSPTRVVNSIVWGNTSLTNDDNIGGKNGIVSYSAVEGGFPGIHNITIFPENAGDGTIHPYFSNPSVSSGVSDSTPNTDWHLLSGSPCVNHGDNTYAAAYDLDGETRILHDTVDMGCYESDFNSTVTLPQYGNIVYVTESGAGDHSGRSWENATPSLQNALDLAYTSRADVWVAQGTYYGDGTSTNAFIMKERVNVYGGFAGNEPEDYDLSQRDFDAHPTILDGQHQQRVLYQIQNFADSTAVVWDGFTIQNGAVYNYGAGVVIGQYACLNHCIIQNNAIYYNPSNGYSTVYGAGVYAMGSKLTTTSGIKYTTVIKNCIIRHNSFENNNNLTGWGAGLYASTVEMTHTDISFNTFGYRGGGLYITSAANVRNCIIHDNRSYWGAGVYNAGNNGVYFTNCNIVNNIGTGNGSGVYRYNGTPEFTNCIIWGNKRNYMPDNIYGNGTYTYCAVEEGHNGTGNITLASTNDGFDMSLYYVRFIDPANNDFQLHPTSACVNVGNSEAVTDSLDYYGNPRVFQSIVDIGCSESMGEGNCLSVVNLTADNITTNSARLVWHPAGEESQWVIVYGMDGEQPVTVTVNDTVYTLSGLSFNRSYSAKVRAVCGDTLTSIFSIPVNFQTTCDPTVLDTLDNFTVMTPSDNSTIYDPTVYFGWTSMPQATSYDFYFWVDGQSVPATPTRSGLQQSNLGYILSNYTPGRIYHWKVVAWNECISKSSPVMTLRANPYPDLHVSAVDHSNPVATQTMTVTWTVTNDGEGNTPPGKTWNDYIWITPVDGIGDGFWYDVSEVLLATVPNLTSLNAGESYQNTATVTIPEGYMGNYFLFVLTDQRNVRDINYAPTGQTTAPIPYTPSADGTPYHYLTGTVHGTQNSITELPNHEWDNFFYKLISILPPPSPDLAVSSVVHGGNAISGNTTNVTWTVVNQGEANATGSWMDAVYLSQDTLLDTQDDIRLGRYEHEGPLAVGESYQRTEQVLIPVEYMGDYYFIVVTDNNNTVYEGLGEQNNLGISSPMNIMLTWLTDLAVTAANMPATVDPNGNYTCQYTVTNNGSSPTYTNAWTDAIYLSTSPDFNPATAIRVASVTHNGTLDADTAYTVQQQVHIPDTLSGSFHWFVVVDESNTVFEYGAEDNNTYMYPQSATVRLPDLRVSNIMVPETVNPNESINLRWTVRNYGPGNVVSRSFVDNFSFNGTSFFTVNTNSVSIAAGDSLTRMVNIQLPCGDGSTPVFTIQTDYGQSVMESNEDNNSRSVSPTLVFPDLQLTDFTTDDDNVWSGTTTELSYIVTNTGGVSLHQSQVTDKFYLSTSPDSYQESDLFGQYTHELALMPQEAKDYSLTVTIPNGISGNYYYHIVCNADTTVCENGSMANNVSMSVPVQVHLSPSPDLTITQLTAPAQVYVGAEFELAYTIQNQGDAALQNTTVIQKFYYSTSPVSYDTNKLLASIQDILSLGVNESMTQVTYVHLPINISPSNYFIHAVTDAGDVVYEHNAEGNNTKVSNTIMATLYQLDLQLSEIEGPDIVQWGQTALYRLHVVNNTNLSTLSSIWQDVLYLSNDQALQNSDQHLLTLTHHGRLDGNADYWVDMSVTIPYGAPSNAYLIGITDFNNNNPDINPSNNLLIKGISVNSVPTPDLAIEEIIVLDAVSSGQQARIAYKVTNVGEIPILDKSWNDKLFLSANNTYESNDLQLLTKNRSQMTLAPGEFYRDTLVFTIPLPNNGNMYLLMMANANNTPYEAEQANNLSSVEVSVVLPPPGDLIVRDVTCENTIVSGQILHASWSIQNIGDYGMTGSGLRTLVYVSSDTVFDANDRLLGSLTEDLNLPVDQMMPQHIESKISGLRPGEYYLIVKTDVTNAFNEADDDNNAGHSAMPFTVSIRPLPFNTDVADTLANNEVSDFMLDVGDNVGQTIRIHITSEDSLAGAVNMIYATYNDMGDNLNYSYSTIGQFTANPELYIPATQSGFYGVNIYGSTPSGNVQNVVVRADILPFELTSVNADHGGNTGEVTVQLTGSRFRPDMTVVLRNGHEEITADTLIYVNYYQAFARFDLTGKTPGVYDVSAFNFCEGEAVLPDGFSIEDGVPSGLSYNLIFPSSPRPNRNVVMMLEFGNIGNVDLHDQVLEITSLGATPISLTPEGVSQNQTVLQVPLSIDGEPEGLLRVGSYGTINIYGFTSGALMFTIKPIVEQ